MRDRSIRFAALAAVTGAVVGLVLTPYMATAGVFSPDIVWADLSTPFERFFGPLVESSGALTFGDAGAAYRLYGKGFFVVYLLLVTIVRLVHRVYRNARGTSRVELRSWWVMYAALLAALFGDFVSYWSLSIPGDGGEFVAVAGFLIEINATGLLLLSSAVYATVAVRFKVLPRWGAGLMIAVVPLSWATGHYLMGYFPNAWTVPYSVAWGALAVWLAVASKRSEGAWPLPIDPQSRPPTTVRTVVQGYWVTGITLLLGVFMLVVGLLVAFSSDGDDGWFGIAYGMLAVVSGVAILGVVYLLGSHQVSASRGRLVMAVSLGVAAIGYFWVVVPVVLGVVVGWFGIHRNRTTAELVHQHTKRALS